MCQCEYGKCSICGQEAVLSRKYYNYDIECNCHKGKHFEVVRYCKKCIPKPPRETRIVLGIEKLKPIED